MLASGWNDEEVDGRTIAVSGDGFSGPVHVREDGPADAPPLVLLHGFGGSLHWYDDVVALLADTFRVIRVDLLGHGGTGGRAADAPRQAQMVEAVLANLEVTGATAVGHSFGADVAVELAERSARVERLVIVTQAPDYSDAVLPRGRALMTVPLLGPALHGFARLIAGPLSRLVRPRRALVEQAVRDLRALDSGMFRIVLVKRRDRMARRPLDTQLREAGKPALVILGGHDHFYGDRSAPRYRAAGARVEVIPDSGHSPCIEFPERTAELIRDFAAAPVAS